jgi:predicted phage-related endonuclease
VFEAKHVSAFAKPDEVLAKYLPQLTHNMLVAGLTKADLSVLFGNHKWERFEVTLDADYAEQLMAIEEAFWRCVQTRTRPHAIEVKAPIPVSAMRVVDMAGSNAWSVAAADWAANKVAAKTFEDAAKTLKALVADDVKEAFGAGVQAKRNAAGSISISEIKPPKGKK